MKNWSVEKSRNEGLKNHEELKNNWRNEDMKWTDSCKWKIMVVKIYSTIMLKCNLNKEDLQFKFPLEEINIFKEESCFNK